MARFLSFHVSQRSRVSTRRQESGQVLIMFVLLIPVLLGMTALAIDVGTYASHRRALQNSADAMALAAAQELPDQADAEAAALSWGAKYGLSADDLDITTTAVSSSNPNPSVKVVITRPHAFQFIKALGVGDADVGATATAIKTSPGGVGNVVPWAVLDATRLASQPGDTVVLKYDSNNPDQGNFGAIRLDGNGSSVYRDSIEQGSSSLICAEGISSCVDTSPVCEGAVCQSETGNMVGSTKSGVDYRISNTDAHCDTMAEVFTGPTDGQYSLNPACNPWVDGSYTSLRVIVLPVIQSLCNGSCDVTVTGFSLFWLDGYQYGSCTGSSCEIEGRFISADVTLGALVGKYDPAAGLHYALLVE